MRALAARYLLDAKRSDGLPYDPVARFHLGNGATVHAVHAGADISDKGRSLSGGTMVNYLYDLGKVAQNHEAFVTTQKIVASSDVKSAANAATVSTAKER